MTDESLVERRRREKGGELALAGATAAIQALTLIRTTLARTRLPQKTLASELGVTEGRVSQILNGDGNIRLATLGRVLHAAGFHLRLSAERIADGAIVVAKKTPREFTLTYTLRGEADTSDLTDAAPQFIFSGVEQGA